MKKVYNYASASFRVWYDKVYEYAAYYVGAGDEYSPTLDDNERLGDYATVIDAGKYTNEEDNRRIFNGPGFISKYRSFFSDPTHIIDNIYLGSAFNAASYQTIKDLDIKVIINVSYELSKYHDGNDRFTYHQYSVHDDNKQSILNILEAVYDDITSYDADTNILVHCYMGASRSVSMVTYYLTKKHGLSVDEAIAFIKEKRPIINPSHRFAKDLAKSQLMKKEGPDEPDREPNALIV